MEQPSFDLHQIYRALEIIAKEADSIQTSLYSNSLAVSKRNTRVLYYDCTNYFFEIEQESGIKQYGYSKEHRPNPIVHMGLFMYGDGVPLAVYIGQGNTNEQLTLKPLEKKILSDFNCSKFIVCTDAGLASNSNRQFNNQGERAFITTQSVKKLKKHLKEWALSPEGWHLPDDSSIYSLDKLDENKDLEKTFYKERWIVEDGLEQKLIVSFSLKYQNYQRKVRNAQIERARKVLNTNLGKLTKVNQNDYKRFIKKTMSPQRGR
jgi:transposase